MDQPPFAKAWLEQWKHATAALQQVHDDELRGLSGENARRAVDAVLSMGDGAPVATERWSSSGLVEQQRIFQRYLRLQSVAER